MKMSFCQRFACAVGGLVMASVTAFSALVTVAFIASSTSSILSAPMAIVTGMIALYAGKVTQDLYTAALTGESFEAIRQKRHVKEHISSSILAPK